jgi:hypothetical protein
MMRRAAAWLLMAAGGVVVGVGACGPKSPIVGTEGGGKDDDDDDRVVGTGKLDGTGTAAFFSYPLVVNVEGVCLPKPLPVDEGGAVSCSIYSAFREGAEGCSCDAPARRPPVHPAAYSIVRDELHLSGLCGGDTDVYCIDYCVCEETQAVGESAIDCLTQPAPSDESFGWCYLDPDHGEGEPALVADCPDSQRQRVRMLTDPPAGDSVYVIACSGGSSSPSEPPPGRGELGAPCVPSDESQAGFNGFGVREINLEIGSAECASNLCLVNHFQGRTSCPYGQSAEQAQNDPACFVPGTDEPVRVPVDPQLMARSGEHDVICSCRCAGPDELGDYCRCSEGMECHQLILPTGDPRRDTYAGSYCMPAGTHYDDSRPLPADICTMAEMNCGDPRPY